MLVRAFALVQTTGQGNDRISAAIYGCKQHACRRRNGIQKPTEPNVKAPRAYHARRNGRIAQKKLA